jgi:hypothetical protein
VRIAATAAKVRAYTIDQSKRLKWRHRLSTSVAGMDGSDSGQCWFGHRVRGGRREYAQYKAIPEGAPLPRAKADLDNRDCFQAIVTDSPLTNGADREKQNGL